MEFLGLFNPWQRLLLLHLSCTQTKERVILFKLKSSIMFDERTSSAGATHDLGPFYEQGGCILTSSLWFPSGSVVSFHSKKTCGSLNSPAM